EVKPDDPGSKQYVALAHFKFVHFRNHPFCCEWFARVFVLTLQGQTWTVNQTDKSLIYRARHDDRVRQRGRTVPYSPNQGRSNPESGLNAMMRTLATPEMQDRSAPARPAINA